MKGKGLIRICTVFLVIVSMLAMNVPMVSAAVTYAPTITVTNNPTGTPDTVVVKGSTTSTVYAGDIVKVYRVANSTATISGAPIGQAVASGTGKLAQATVSLSQLGTTAGFIKVRVTPPAGSTNGTVERDVTAAKPYVAEKAAGITDPLVKATTATSVYARNYYNLDDIVVVTTTESTKYPDGSVVKVYRSSSTSSKVVLGKGIITSGVASIEIPQLGTRAGSVYVSVTKTVYSESKRLAVPYFSEISEGIPAAAITVANNHDSGASTDTVTITASKLTGTKVLAVGDKINIYRGASGSTTLVGETELDDIGNQTITLTSDLGLKASKLYITRTSSGKKESARTAVSYKAENTSKPLSVTNVTYTNNRYGTKDTITVSNTTASSVYDGCKIYVYEEIGGGTAVANATVSGDSATIELPATSTFLDANGGTFYVSIERVKENESNRTAIKYKGETQLSADEIATKYGLATGTGNGVNGSVTITNKAEGIEDTDKDTVVLTDGDLASGDILRLYATSKATDKDIIGEVTVTSSPATITVTQLPQPLSVTAAVYMTITPKNSVESARYELTYASDNAYLNITPTATDTSSADGSASDYVTVSGLDAYDTVKVYDAATGGNLLGAEVVDASATSTTINNLLLPSGGTIYVSITKLGAQENANRISATYTVVP